MRRFGHPQGIAANVKSRVSGLQSHNPVRIDIVASKLVEQAYEAEQELHRSLADMRAEGANEWFKLTPEQAIELAITMNKYPDLDISERVTLAAIVKQQRRTQRVVETKLDYVINSYQRHFAERKRRETAKESPAPAAPKPELVEHSDPVEVTESQKPDPIRKRLIQLDEDVKRALVVIESEGKASTSMLQGRLSMGYGRAARVIDELESRGFITSLNGIAPRKLVKRQAAA